IILSSPPPPIAMPLPEATRTRASSRSGNEAAICKRSRIVTPWPRGIDRHHNRRLTTLATAKFSGPPPFLS
ncbi:hypothetical protein CH063_15158, partial [Colletotrichum higginsianum]